MKRLVIGDAAPVFSAKTIGGQAVSADGLKGKAYIAIFTRYVGCPICQMYVAGLREIERGVRDAGGEMLVFFRSGTESLARYFKEFKHEYSVLGDPTGKIFRSFGVRGSLLGYLSPKTLRAAARAGKSGYRHGAFEHGELQMPAEFVIDPRGRISYAHYGAHADDHTPNQSLIDELRKATGK